MSGFVEKIRMKLFIKILLVVLVVLIANLKVVSASISFTNIQEATTSYSFHRELSEIDSKVIENDLANCCQNGQDLVDYRNWGTGIEAVAAKTSSRAFFSGAGTEARAINDGFTTLSQTRAGQNLMKMTEGMPYYPGSQAYNWWARLSSTYAKGIPKGSNVNVFLNNPSPTGIWNAVEKPILKQRGINIIYK